MMILKNAIAVLLVLTTWAAVSIHAQQRLEVYVEDCELNVGLANQTVWVQDHVDMQGNPLKGVTDQHGRVQFITPDPQTGGVTESESNYHNEVATPAIGANPIVYTNRTDTYGPGAAEHLNFDTFGTVTVTVPKYSDWFRSPMVDNAIDQHIVFSKPNSVIGAGDKKVDFYMEIDIPADALAHPYQVWVYPRDNPDSMRVGLHGQALAWGRNFGTFQIEVRDDYGYFVTDALARPYTLRYRPFDDPTLSVDAVLGGTTTPSGTTAKETTANTKAFRFNPETHRFELQADVVVVTDHERNLVGWTSGYLTGWCCRRWDEGQDRTGEIAPPAGK